MDTQAQDLHKAPGKGWTHYLYEFLMLFLAVSCGFLADNIREHREEQERAEVLAKNLYEEILADSITIQQTISVREKKESECAYFIAYVKDSSLTNLNDHFYRSFSWAFIQTVGILFEPNDGILNELRNSGELRYFKNPELQAAVGEIGVDIANIRTRNEKEYNMVEINLRPFTLKYYDFEWYKTLTGDGKISFYDAMMQNLEVPVNGKIPNLDQFDRKEAENLASYYLLMLHSTRVQQYAKYTKINHELLEILRKEYNLK